MPSKKLALPDQGIDDLIRQIRGQRVILDSDLAHVYGVSTKAFNQAVKRNLVRFPEDFVFRLSNGEAEAVLISRSQNVTMKRGQLTGRPDSHEAAIVHVLQQLMLILNPPPLPPESPPKSRIGFSP